MSSELKALLGIGAATLLILVGGVFFLSNSPSTPQDIANQSRVDKEILARKDSYSIGTPSAKVTVVEFGDYQCPACGSAHPIIKQITEDYKDKIYFQFRHFPLPQHRNAKLAALVAEAAGLQGKFWEMHNFLYENQAEWAESSKPMEFVESYAEKLELDVEKLREDIKKQELTKKINRDTQDAGAAGVNSTPTFYVNGLQFRGVPQYADLQKLIDDELKK
ncbi:MAG: DsbA family protein [Candidatus Levybacteria bacterium]|nr:DsbA family protein [Candidatus Levybacteria bacterium]